MALIWCVPGIFIQSRPSLVSSWCYYMDLLSGPTLSLYLVKLSVTTWSILATGNIFSGQSGPTVAG
jgi:hypothetical protein